MNGGNGPDYLVPGALGWVDLEWPLVSKSGRKSGVLLKAEATIEEYEDEKLEITATKILSM